jgi:Zn-finger nucleic acid-binding protein
MTKKQLKLYDLCRGYIQDRIGFKDGTVDGLSIDYCPSKGTWYIQGHGYLDDLVVYNEIPETLKFL